MNHEIDAMFTAAEGRYPTKAELALLREWAARLDARAAAVEEMRTKEEAIVRLTLQDVARAYPDLDKRIRDARQKCARDLTLVLRYCAAALLRGDPKHLEDTFLTWFATILRGIGFAYPFVSDTYTTLARHAAAELSPPVAEMFRPYLELCVTTLTGAIDRQKAVAT